MGLHGLPDVMTMTFAQRTELEERIQSALTLVNNRVAGIKTVEALRERIAECVRWNTLNARPVSSSHLNRLFGRVAKACGTSVTGLVVELLSSGRLDAFDPSAPKQLVVDAQVWAEVRAKWAEFGTEASALEQWRANAR